MSATGWTSSVVPFGADQTVYIVVDSFSANGVVYRESEIERIDLESVICDFLTGLFNDPVRVIAFNTLEHWSDDVSKDVAAEIRSMCDVDTRPGGSCRNSSIRPAYLPAAAHRRRRNLVGDVSVYIDILSYGCSERTYLKALLMPQCSCIKH